MPARNTIFLSFALAWAEVLEAGDIFIGVNALDYSGYPDCRPEYIAAFERMANLATRGGVEGTNPIRIRTPLIDLTKAQIIRHGVELGVDYSMTQSCYDPDRLRGGVRALRRLPAAAAGLRRGRTGRSRTVCARAVAILDGMYTVKEIFYTLQGEGANAGRPAVFCRFSGCNLWTGREADRATAVCDFCDTDFVGVGPGRRQVRHGRGARRRGGVAMAGVGYGESLRRLHGRRAAAPTRRRARSMPSTPRVRGRRRDERDAGSARRARLDLRQPQGPRRTATSTRE